MSHHEPDCGARLSRFSQLEGKKGESKALGACLPFPTEVRRSGTWAAPETSSAQVADVSPELLSWEPHGSQACRGLFEKRTPSPQALSAQRCRNRARLVNHLVSPQARGRPHGAGGDTEGPGLGTRRCHTAWQRLEGGEEELLLSQARLSLLNSLKAQGAI